MITTSKHYIKYIRIIYNSGYENYLEQGQIYGVLEQMQGDVASYYKLDVNTPYQEGLWVNKSRVEFASFYTKPRPTHTIDLQSMLKQPVQRIVCIPDESGHIVDLQRVQYISPLDDKKEGKPYSVTLVSGWEMKLTDDVYSREKLIVLWRALQNK